MTPSQTQAVSGGSSRPASSVGVCLGCLGTVSCPRPGTADTAACLCVARPRLVLGMPHEREERAAGRPEVGALPAEELGAPDPSPSDLGSPRPLPSRLPRRASRFPLLIHVLFSGTSPPPWPHPPAHLPGFARLHGLCLPFHQSASTEASCVSCVTLSPLHDPVPATELGPVNIC